MHLCDELSRFASHLAVFIDIKGCLSIRTTASHRSAHIQDLENELFPIVKMLQTPILQEKQAACQLSFDLYLEKYYNALSCIIDEQKVKTMLTFCDLFIFNVNFAVFRGKVGDYFRKHVILQTPFKSLAKMGRSARAFLFETEKCKAMIQWTEKSPSNKTPITIFISDIKLKPRPRLSREFSQFIKHKLDKSSKVAGKFVMHQEYRVTDGVRNSCKDIFGKSTYKKARKSYYRMKIMERDGCFTWQEGIKFLN